MLLNKAKLELGIGNFGKLKKQLAKNKFHEKMQERYMAIARDKRIAKLYGKMPPQWTFWEKCVRLSDDDFHKVKHLITCRKPKKKKLISQKLTRVVFNY
jgi:hypothetical protein